MADLPHVPWATSAASNPRASPPASNISPLNNQELDRGTSTWKWMSARLREIYLPAFKAAVQEAGVSPSWALTTSSAVSTAAKTIISSTKSSKANGVSRAWSCPIGTAPTTPASARFNGLDLEMGTENNYDDYYFANPYLEGLRKGELPMAGLDDKVRRNFRVMLATHVFDAGPQPARSTPRRTRPSPATLPRKASCF